MYIFDDVLYALFGSPHTVFLDFDFSWLASSGFPCHCLCS